MTRRFFLMIAGLSILLSFIVFGGALSHGFSMIDDPYLITQNLFVRGLSFQNLRYVFTHFDPELYMPLTFVSYQLNYALGGLNPAIFHATNILLHGINGALVIALLWLLFRNRTSAILGGLIFLVHPLNTEAVVWVAGRKDLLSTGLFLGSLIAYLLHLQSPPLHDAAATKMTMYWVSLGLFLLALLSKAMVLTLPAILILLIFIPENRKPTLQSILKLAPYVILSFVFGAVALVGKERIVQSSTLTQTILMAGKSTVFYLQKIVWPTGLTPLYPYHNAISISSPDFYIPLIILAIIAVGAIVSLKWTRWIAIGLAFFLVTLSPTYLNFHKGTVAFFAVDRYAYLPMIGVLIALCGIGSQSSGKRQVISGKAVPVAGTIIVLILAILSTAQTSTWSTDESVLTRSLLLYPDSIPARLSLAVIYRQEGRINDERSVLESGLTFRDDVAYRTGLGSIDARQGNLDEARKQYELGQKLDPRNPEPLFFLGSLEEQLNHPDKALELYKQAIALDDSYVSAYINAGAILLDRGDLPAAEIMFRTALRWNPSTMEANYNLFDVLERRKKPEEGFPFLIRAYQLNPDDPDIGLAYAYRLIDQKNLREANAVLNHLLAINPDNRAAQRLKEATK